MNLRTNQKKLAFTGGFLVLLNPIAPHITEELNELILSSSRSLTYAKWPKWDEELAKDEIIVDATPDVPDFQPEPTPAPPEEVPPQGNLASQDAKPALISEAQRKRFYAIAKASGKSDGEIKSFLREHIGSESTGDIQKGVYEYLCNEVGKQAAV